MASNPNSEEKRLLKKNKASLVEDLVIADQRIRDEVKEREKYQFRYNKLRSKTNEAVGLLKEALSEKERLRQISQALELKVKELEASGGTFKDGLRTHKVGNAFMLQHAKKSIGKTKIKQVPFHEALSVAGNATMQGLNERPMPDFIRWHVQQGQRQVFLMELPPVVRSMRIATSGYGSSAKYKIRRLATPYVIMKIAFNGSQVDATSGEIFYRAEPIEDGDSELYWANLFNLSPNSYGQTAWFCTQYLHNEKHDGTIWGQLDALQNHLWGAGFNRSSEEHEGDSCFSLYEKNSDDKRITSVDEWEKASLENAKFVTQDVKWLPVMSKKVGGKRGIAKFNKDGKPIGAMTVRQLIEEGIGSTYGQKPVDPSKAAYDAVSRHIVSNGMPVS